jgi:hypothetical protein
VCLAVFIGTDSAVEEIDFDGANPGFWVSRDDDPRARRYLTRRHVCFAGAHERCSCAFHDDDDDPVAPGECRRRLAAFVTELAGSGSVEVLVDYPPDEDDTEQAARRRELAACDLEDPALWKELLDLTAVQEEPQLLVISS